MDLGELLLKNVDHLAIGYNRMDKFNGDIGLS